VSATVIFWDSGPIWMSDKPVTMTALMSLGEQAVLAYFADEDAALRFAAVVRRDNPAWLIDVVQAYASVAVFHDLERCNFSTAADHLRRLAERADHSSEIPAGRQHVIPCCYEMGPDVGRVARDRRLSVEDVIRLHCATEYRVYAIGFCPGFPYLGYLPPPLCGVPRKEEAAPRVEAGSVGLTGRQTGIYTLARPGGWNIVGRTPLVLVDVADGYFPMRTGDCVRFRRIDDAEFRRLQGKRLE
jgi:inhibitor of KinA